MYIQKSFKSFKKKNERLIGLKSFADSCPRLSNFGMKMTLTLIYGIWPKFNHALKMSTSHDRIQLRASCNIFRTIPSRPDDLKGETDLIAHATFPLIIITSKRC